MKRLTGFTAALFLVCAASAAGAQTAAKDDSSLETVIVTAPRLSDEVKAVIHNFVTAFAVPAPISGVITRWDIHRPLCPMTYGFTEASDNEFVTARVRQIGVQVGAPLQRAPCSPNVEIYFASSPQEFLDSIREHGGAVLFNSKPSRARQTAVLTHPIQAWYATATRDICGTVSFDNEDMEASLGISVGCPAANSGQYAVEGSRIHTGLQSLLGHVYVVVDVNQTAHTSFQAVADYIALLALSRTQDFESCQPLASIANLMTAGCGAKPGAITATDLAYLTGIYKMNPGASLTTQRSTIASQIKAAVGSQ